MKTYEKIETIYKRDIDGTKRLIPGEYRNEMVKYMSGLEWEWTEKVDGTNIRVWWDGHGVSFGGRTERAQIPAQLLKRLNELFSGEESAQIFEQLFGDGDTVLFGEGYGKGIQAAGGRYNPEGVDFILFDVLYKGRYFDRASVQAFARAFGIMAVPIVGRGPLIDAVDFVKTHPKSTLGDVEMEGVVCRPIYETYDKFGDRMIVKIKWADFKHFAGGDEA